MSKSAGLAVFWRGKKREERRGGRGGFKEELSVGRGLGFGEGGTSDGRGEHHGLRGLRPE
jgi:hypothetical protein